MFSFDDLDLSIKTPSKEEGVDILCCMSCGSLTCMLNTSKIGNCNVCITTVG